MLARERLYAWSGLIGLSCAAVIVRAHGLHRGLIYPDGYDYLLMARGIRAHLTPTIRLGPGGVLFVPPVDAALKPLFPAVVAGLSLLRNVRAAADTVTVASGAATVVLAGALAGRLSGSRASFAIAAALALTSPALGYWSGFVGPDQLAVALALATALAVVSERMALAGALGALCAATRPEWLLVSSSAALAALALPAWRAQAQRALITGAFVLAGVVALLRPPLSVPPGGAALLIGALAAGVALYASIGWAAAGSRRATVAVAGGIGLVVAAVASERLPAVSGLVRAEWPLLAVAVLGLLRACWTGRERVALSLLTAMLLLGSAYTYRNAGSERYLAELLPLACVAAGLAAAPLAAGAAARSRARTRLLEVLRLVVPAGSIALGLLVAPARPGLATDTFSALAGRLAGAPAGTLVSAAPDAYGLLLPARPQQQLRPGATGLILLDGAQREYAPGLSARGRLIARLTVPDGFERPNGTIDVSPALLVEGVVVRAVTTARHPAVTASSSGPLQSTLFESMRPVRSLRPSSQPGVQPGL